MKTLRNNKVAEAATLAVSIFFSLALLGHYKYSKGEWGKNGTKAFNKEVWRGNSAVIKR